MISEWAELARHAQRAAPRFESSYGRCPVCGFGATWIQPVCSVWWARCEPCETRWPLDVSFSLVAVEDDEDDDQFVLLNARQLEEARALLLYELMLQLARSTPVEPLKSALREER